MAAALERAGESELRQTLTAPAVDCRVLMTLDRVRPPEAAPVYAARLAGLADDVLDRDLQAGLRLALEAHRLFAGRRSCRRWRCASSSASGGPPWATMLRRASQAAWAAGGRELARDRQLAQPASSAPGPAASRDSASRQARP